MTNSAIRGADRGVMERATVDGMELEYELKGSGEPVLLIPAGPVAGAFGEVGDARVDAEEGAGGGRRARSSWRTTRGNRRGDRRRRFLLTAVVAAMLTTSAPAFAKPAAPCSYGDAQSQFQTFPLMFDGTMPPCQYRLFLPGTVTFSEDDFFLGGLVERVSYGGDVSRSQAIATLEALRFRVWLAEVTPSGTGPPVEQIVERTAIKTANYEPFGQHVWAQWGIIRRLPAGEYLSVLEDPPIYGGTTTTVRLVITPTS